MKQGARCQVAMVAHMFLDQPANLRYRTNLFAIGLVIRLPLVLSKLNVKCDNRRFSCSTKRHLCPTRLLSLNGSFIQPTCVCAIVFLCIPCPRTQVPARRSSSHLAQAGPCCHFRHRSNIFLLFLVS